MPEDVHEIPAAHRKLLLEQLGHSPAFALFCDRWDHLITEEVEKPIFDPATDDAKTRELKLVRKQLTGLRHPRKVLETLIRSTFPPAPQQP